jgi:restriction endonuclease S subunit
MTTFQEVRLGDLAPAIAITKGFPTQRALSEGEVRVMSVAALRNTAPPKHFAERDAIADIGLELGQPGDLLVAIEGGTVGETLVVPEGIDEFVPSQQAATLRVVDTARLNPWYLGAWLATEPAQEQLRRLARGLGIQRIPIKDLASLIVRVPPLQDQREIGERFHAFETAIQSHRAVTACLEELRDIDLVVTFASASDTVSDTTSKSGKVTAHGR